MATFPLKIMTPDGDAFDGAVTSETCRTIKGQIQLLARHIDICTALGMGEAHIKLEDGTVRRAACMGGMLSMLGGECHLLATTFEWADTIDAERAARSKARAEALLAQKNLDKRDMQLAEARIRRALVRRTVDARKDIRNRLPSPFGGGVLNFEPAAKHCGQCLKRPAALAFCARTRYNTDMNTAMIYILIMNVIGFCLMGLDKHRARTQQWRVPEKSLFGAALLGGSVGAWAGMYVFHHKTRHWYFVVGIPLILAAQLALAVYFTR